MLVFTGGIGEHSARVRTETCRGLRHLGIVFDERRNATVADDSDISVDEAPVRTLVIHAREGSRNETRSRVARLPVLRRTVVNSRNASANARTPIHAPSSTRVCARLNDQPL